MMIDPCKKGDGSQHSTTNDVGMSERPEEGSRRGDVLSTYMINGSATQCRRIGLSAELRRWPAPLRPPRAGECNADNVPPPL